MSINETYLGKKAQTDEMRLKIEELTGICDTLQNSSNIELKKVGASLMGLVRNLSDYVLKSADYDRKERLLLLETESIDNQNKNLLTLLSMSVGLVKLVKGWSENTQIKGFVSSAEKYVSNTSNQGMAASPAEKGKNSDNKSVKPD